MTILPYPRLFSKNPTIPPSAQPSLQPSKEYAIQSLRYYAVPGVPPPSSRVDPNFRLKPRRPMRLWDYCKWGLVIASKASEVTGDVLSHHIWGPRKKSWGIEMTILSSLFRGAGSHSSLIDIGTVRTLMSIGGLVPLPSDALVTPVTFRVKKRNLRGFLKDLDAAETGNRELSGEWVVGRRTWQRLQAEWKSTNFSERQREPLAPSHKRKERVILYIHGGAYYLSSAAAQRIISIPLSKYTDSRVFALDYRLAPETRFPGPLHDVVSGYMRLVDDLHIPPENIIICGDSAGGALSLALLLYLRDNDYPLPSGAILMSPWVDLTMSCESWDSNALFDVVPFPSADNHMNPIGLYLGDHTERYLTHPYASPLFGDFEGIPPLLIQAGDAEVLRDEITLLAHKATLAGVEVRHELYEDAIHVFHAYPFLDSTRRSFESMRNFVRDVLPHYQSLSPQMLAASAEKGLEQEIENDNVLVVNGDGAEVESGMAGVKETLNQQLEDDLVAENESDEDKSSWVRSPGWTIGKNSDQQQSESTPRLSISLPMPTLPRRSRSGVSLRLPSRPHLHRRSSQNLLRSAGAGLSMSSMNMGSIVGVGVGMSMSAHSPPPSPSVRRRMTSASHPDITSLVENWSKAGPANHTFMYKT